jgi:FtsH-binding integral membrane protein
MRKTTSKSGIVTLLEQNTTLLRNVFLTLIAQLLITFVVVYSLRYYPQVTELLRNLWFSLLLFVICIILIFFIASPYSIPIRLFCFTLFSIVFGVLLSYLNRVSPAILTSALAGTIGIFVVMFIAGFILTSYGYNLTWLGVILFISLLMLIIVQLLSLCFGVGDTTRKIQLYIGLVIFSLYILFDTFDVVKRKDFIDGAMSYYLDIINIFIRLVQVIGNR